MYVQYDFDKTVYSCYYQLIRQFLRLYGPVEGRPPSGSAAPPSQPPPRPPLARADSRSSFYPPAPRPAAPGAPQQRPQFQPGGPVTNPPQFAPRPGTPAPRGPAPPGPPQNQGPRLPVPPRPATQQPFAPQQAPRPQQPLTGAPLRAPPPNNLQFGPRQPPQFGGGVTPDGTRPLLPQQSNGVIRNGAPSTAAPYTQQALSRQSSQGSIKGAETLNAAPNKQSNLDTQSVSNENQNSNKMETYDVPGAPKSRSYSVAAPLGAPSPLKVEDDRRKSISVVGGRVDDMISRSPGLGFIQESKVESQDNIRGSKESVKGQEVSDRPESRISTKMTDSFIESLPTATNRKRADDDDDVVLQNISTASKNMSLGKPVEQSQNKVDMSDRSPSLSRSEDSPELKQPAQNVFKTAPNQNGPPEPQRPKTPSSQAKTESKSNIDTTPIKYPPKSPVMDSKPPISMLKKPTELNTNSSDSKKSTPRKTASAPKYRTKDGDNDSGVDESTQGNDLNGSPNSPNKKTPSRIPKEKSNGSLKPSLSRSSSKSAAAKTPESPVPGEKKKVPMNKIQVGNAPSPNIKAVKSKIGSLDNATYKPGGGKVKIENRKLDFNNVTPKIAAKNDTYAPSGGAKKITTTKLEWNASSKIGSLQNATYKPGGGDKKIETKKLDFKEKAKPKVSSTVNITHKPGGGDVKDNYYMSINEWTEQQRPLTRTRSARAPRTPRSARSPRRDYTEEEERRISRNNERNRRASMARPMSAREPTRSACSRGGPLSQRPAFTVY
ncbi:microtubule-associated protein tau isoform X3 [Plutella xylostella]|uniref:microtubule-associated protein tau isoform X3 n=1 Tax=Plutella xylostella TaxID=51655 RepID=UPI002032CEE8|nr:microtubule-associated protein tau isoform X3 [Plutella xylostella]